jgi:lipoyl-dependent peroxiredoxin subunit D
MTQSSLDFLKEALGAAGKDVRLNLSSVLTQHELSKAQTWGTALACAATVNNKVLFETISHESRAHLTEVERLAALTASSVMGSNNIYYRFLHLAGDPQLESLPARLRMNSLKGHGVPEVDFELYCLAVSAITGCGKCIESHYHLLRERDLSRDAILASVRIAAVIHSAARTLEAVEE